MEYCKLRGNILPDGCNVRRSGFLEAESGESVPHNSINYDYLCWTDEVLAADHIQNDFVPYPECDSDDLDYYRLNGQYYDRFDSDQLLRDMNRSIYGGEKSFVLQVFR